MSVSTWRLQQVIALARGTIESLRSQHGLVLDSDDEILTALADEQVDVKAPIGVLVRAAIQARADAAGARARIDALTERHARFERTEERLREAILTAMQLLELPRLRDPEFTLSLRPGKPRVHITDEARLPTHCVHHTVLRRPDRDAIRDAIADREALIAAAIQRGETPPPPFEGAVLTNAPPVLTIGTK